MRQECPHSLCHTYHSILPLYPTPTPRRKCLTGLKLPTSLIRLTLRLPGDGVLPTLSREESCMRSSLIRRCVSAVCLTVLLLLFSAEPSLLAQGGEPQYFAIRGARVVPVAGPPIENGTVVLGRRPVTSLG